MKKLFAAVLLAMSSLAFAGPNDVVITQRNSTDSGTTPRTLASPSTPGLLYFNPTTSQPAYMTLGSGLTLSSGVLSGATPVPQVPADWAASSGVSAILNKPTLFSGAYADLTGKPSLFSGSWADIVGKPAFATVASTGAYADLSGKPSLFSGVYADLTGKPSFATVASTGAYNDLSGKPVLAAVASTGSYADLTNKPAIPTVPTAVTMSMPTAKALTIGTAYQCTDSLRPCLVVVNLNSVANLSLSGGTTITGEIRVGSTNAVATGGGQAVGLYKNSLTSPLSVTININTESYNTIMVPVPAGYYYAVRQTAGTLVIVSAYESSVGLQ